MARSVYVTAMEPGSGKSVVTLGLMEMLSARVERLGFYRPMVASATELDPQIELVRRRYRLDASYEEMHALSDEEAQAAIASGVFGQIEKQVVSGFRTLEDRCDVVICEGTDFAGSTPAVDLDLNAGLANDLGCPVLVVVRGGTVNDTVKAVRVARETLEQKGCDLFGVIASRVPPEMVAEVAQALEGRDDDRPIYVIPEQADLARPTMADVAAALGARPLFGDASSFHRQVGDVRIAAMSVEHFIDDLVEGTLVIVPGDRPDIVVASLASTLSADLPAVAGIVLTAGYELGPNARRLLEGSPFPVLEVPDRTYAVASAVHSARSVITPGDEHKIAAAVAVFESSVDTAELEERLAVERPSRMTPVMFEYELVERARADRKHIVLPEGDDDRILRAADILLRRGVVDLTILGDVDDIRSRAAGLGLDLSGADLVEPAASPLRAGFAATYHELRKHKGVTDELALETMADETYFGTMMVKAGEADGMVSGAAHTTGDTIRPAFEIVKARKDVSVVSSVFLMSMADRVLVYGDCAVNPQAGHRAARRHRDQLRRDRGHLRGRAADRDAVLLHRPVGEGRGRGRRAGRHGDRARAPPRPQGRGADPVRRRGRRDGGRAEAAGERRGGPGHRVHLPRPRHRQHRLQGGTALVGRGGHRPGATGARQAGERPQPRLPGAGHREHRGDHGDPGAGGGEQGVVSAPGSSARSRRISGAGGGSCLGPPDVPRVGVALVHVTLVPLSGRGGGRGERDDGDRRDQVRDGGAGHVRSFPGETARRDPCCGHSAPAR